MHNLKEAVDTFLQQMASLPSSRGRESLDAILLSPMEAEKKFRQLLAQHPDMPGILEPYLGLIDLFDVPANSRLTLPRSYDEPRFSFDLNGSTYSFPEKYLHELDPTLRRSHGSPCFVEDLEEFKRNWRIFTHNAFEAITNWDNIIVAGGSVLGCLTTFSPHTTNIELNNFYHSSAYNESDIDVFIFGLDPTAAKLRMLEIYNNVCEAVPHEVTCVRTANTVSIHTAWPNRPIQIVLRLYSSPAEVLAGFDVDSACCCYNGEKVYLSPRAFVASVRQCNTIDLSRRSPSYEVRLGKYADRGYEVFYPTLDRTQIDKASVYDRRRKTYPNGLARLLVLEMIHSYPNHFFSLYQPKHRVHPESTNRTNAVDFRPVQKLLASNYSYLHIHIPYKATWDAKMVERLIRRIDHKANSPYNPFNANRRLHRHAAACGNMMRILYANICFNCPAPETPAELELVAEEEMINIRGRIKFILTNPGSQIITRSFRPITENDWTGNAYLPQVNVERDDSIDEAADQDPYHDHRRTVISSRFSLSSAIANAIQLLANIRYLEGTYGEDLGYRHLSKLLTLAHELANEIMGGRAPESYPGAEDNWSAEDI